MRDAQSGSTILGMNSYTNEGSLFSRVSFSHLPYATNMWHFPTISSTDPTPVVSPNSNNELTVEFGFSDMDTSEMNYISGTLEQVYAYAHYNVSFCLLLESPNSELEGYNITAFLSKSYFPFTVLSTTFKVEATKEEQCFSEIISTLDEVDGGLRQDRIGYGSLVFDLGPGFNDSINHD